MGRESKHTLIAIDGQTHAGDALLETDELFVRVEGEPKRRKLALASLKKVRGDGTTLSFDHAGHRYAIEVTSAAKWAERITSPPTLLDKLGIAKGSAVHVAGLEDESAFGALLSAAEIDRVPLGAKASVVVIGITTHAGLSIVKKARAAVGDGLALWIVYPKGRKVLSEDHVRAAAIAAGMVDIKVARFSEEKSALKLVVRKSERAR